MYDIQGALRRRAMAERLEALSRADEATRRAAEAPEAPEAPSRPRHLAEPAVAEPAVAGLAVGTEPRGMRPAQPRAPWTVPTDPVPPHSPASVVAAAPATSVTNGRAHDLPPAVPRPLVEDHPSGETLVAVRAPDQTARLEVPPARVDLGDPPPLRDVDPPVPPGVTLLRDNLGLPPHGSLVVEDPVLVSARVLDELDEPARSPGDVGAGFDAVDEPAGIDLLAPDDGPDDQDDEPPRGGSSAATIADLLRHGGSGLFFQR